MRTESGTTRSNQSTIGSALRGVQSFADRHRLKTRVSTEDGARIIPGKVGHVFEWDDGVFGVLIMPKPPRKQYWGFARRELLAAGFEIQQDGDGEGSATFDPSNPQQAKAAIRAAKVLRTRAFSPEHLEKLKRTQFKAAQRGTLRHRNDERPADGSQVQQLATQSGDV